MGLDYYSENGFDSLVDQLANLNEEESESGTDALERAIKVGKGSSTKEETIKTLPIAHQKRKKVL